MNEPRRHQQVSLRGASAKEITRDALLEKVNQEREFRNYTRRANAAALIVQAAWRRHNDTKIAALGLRQDWENMMKNLEGGLSREQISKQVLRPFLFFTSHLTVRYGKIEVKDGNCIVICFRVVLENMSSSDMHQNFCAMVTGSAEEKNMWFLQSKQLISLCLFILSVFDYSHKRTQDFVLVSLAMRMAVLLTDPQGWNCITDGSRMDAIMAVKNLVQFIGNRRSGLYSYLRKFICKLEGPFQEACVFPKDDSFLIIASAMNLLLRPFHITNITDISGVECAFSHYIVSILTIPWFPQRLPKILVPALRHKSVLYPCLQMLLISEKKILKEISEMNLSEIPVGLRNMPPVGWVLANVVFLATGSDVNSCDSGKFTADLDHSFYLQVIALLAENLLAFIESSNSAICQKEEIQLDDDISAVYVQPLDKTALRFSKFSYMDHFLPVCQQLHLKKLLDYKDSSCEMINLPSCTPERNLFDVAYYYSCMLRLFSALNPVLKSLPVLNMLSFTPGFLFSLWKELEKSLFPKKNQSASSESLNAIRRSEETECRQNRFSRDPGIKWANVLHKITGKALTNDDHMDIKSSSNQVEDQFFDEWEIELLSRGPEGISKSIFCLLHLFCSSYSHLLLVLDDIEFYDKQVPFTLEQQQRIASVVNTLVYNSFVQNISPQNTPLVNSAIRCLHLLYERDCRHQYCPPPLWLSPGKSNRMPIAVAARTHEVFSASDGTASATMGSAVTTMPHVFPFEERVKMFREFISMDKVSRRSAGEVSGPGSRAIEIVIRRDYIFEDGMQQLNSLGSKLKSAIHVSFVSESGLPEAGLDYGGLSKEFLTDVAKAAFSLKYGLFSQSSTSDRLLIPNSNARFLDNGVNMIEFLGRIVGKALYEGTLLDFYFSHVFVQKLLGRYSYLDELSTLDPELYKNLIYVKNYDGDVKELSLDFTVTEESLGKHYVVELISGGKDICVTNENRLQYVHAIADYKLNKQMLPFSNAFYRGLIDLISPSWLKLFNASEFNQLLSGGNQDIDIDDLRKNTQYTGGYNERSRTVKMFWEVFADFKPKERCAVLKFVTSCSRAPLLGFKYLQPSFTIHKVACDVPLWATFGGQDVDRLPSASTCYNTLKLPTYKRHNTLRAKLLYAINSNTGFELS